MKTKAGKTLQVLCALLLAGLVVYIAARHGWRLFGFDLCNAAETVGVYDVKVEDGQVTVVGFTPDSLKSYVGYKYEFEDGNLYIGVKHNAFLGFMRRLGDFYIQVPAAEEPIANVYLKSKGVERLIWSSVDGVVRPKPTAPQSVPEGQESPTKDSK